jgi:(S)-ureidoglycine-glyoxylate aminotransferase
MLSSLMAVADLSLPSRLLAGGGPSSPDPRVLRALGLPLIGQFDPDFTVIMDNVMAMARPLFLTSNARCFPVSGLAAAGLEALLNTLLEEGDQVAIGGGPRFVAETADIARRLGGQVHTMEELAEGTRLVVVPLVDPSSGQILPIEALATRSHQAGARLCVDATYGLAACELRVDDWHVDAACAGVDFAIGAPSGMALVTYTSELEARMQARQSPPRTSYLDLLQLQAYWSPERLNHHTAPTSLVYGLREALRLVHDEGLEQRWMRHRRIGQTLRDGLAALGLDVAGAGPYAIVRVPDSAAAAETRRSLLEQFGIHVSLIDGQTWRIGLLGADARSDAAQRVLTAMEHVITEKTKA